VVCGGNQAEWNRVLHASAAVSAVGAFLKTGCFGFFLMIPEKKVVIQVIKVFSRFPPKEGEHDVENNQV
jgi:hypothetical protein